MINIINSLKERHYYLWRFATIEVVLCMSLFSSLIWSLLSYIYPESLMNPAYEKITMYFSPVAVSVLMGIFSIFTFCNVIYLHHNIWVKQLNYLLVAIVWGTVSACMLVVDPIPIGFGNYMALALGGGWGIFRLRSGGLM